MEFLSEYYTEDGDRRSEIYLDGNGVYNVQFFRNEKLVEQRAYPDKNINYIEDAADNWVRGILKL